MDAQQLWASHTRFPAGPPAEAYSVPPELADLVTQESNEHYIHLCKDCVETIPGDYREWTLLGPIDDNAEEDEGFVINCVRPEHPVGSFTMCNQGSFAMCWLFDNYKQFLEARTAWEAAPVVSDRCRTFARYARLKAGTPLYE